MADILVLGMAVADFVFQMERFPTDPIKYKADKAEVIGGGIAANASVAIARLGGTARFVGRLGEDALADLILSELIAEGVETSFVDRAKGGRSMFSSADPTPLPTMGRSMPDSQVTAHMKSRPRTLTGTPATSTTSPVSCRSTSGS